MSLLSQLHEERELLQEWIDSAEASQGFTDFPVDPIDIEGARIRLGRVQKLIDSLL